MQQLLEILGTRVVEEWEEGQMPRPPLSLA